jgi:molybdopterin synthase sulfur carrier subunit
MKIIYFSWLKETLGISEENINLPKNIKNIKDLIKWLSTKSVKHRKVFLKSKNILCSSNHQIVDKNSKIKNNDEIAFFPPFTGG